MSECEEEEVSERTRIGSKAWPTNTCKTKASQAKTSAMRVKEQETSQTNYIGWDGEHALC